ncbi:hypothetical protein IQ247_06375 [Plectonema cf. radiosum LEGE 06105]|uniref:Uncharacterized protein n=1 Tax=Plectonema cf. radiosum LEGE 06105 TaxID=945769 RepID=A0A8J7FDN4_9CYAN|nr:hypothetical protein [Plectonema radiosum]MBE9212336.1 hypothetical protein [Plectonema cf. radiosum LEGE 06105]
MPFQKNNQLGAKKIVKGELDQLPICFKGRAGQKEKLKTIPDWQERLREFVDILIAGVDNLDRFD